MGAYSSTAQLLLQSRVINISNRKPLKNVRVWNVTSNSQSFTDTAGYFSIQAKQGDRIKFSLDNFYTKELLLLADEWNVIDVITLEKMVITDTATNLNPYQKDSVERFRMYELVLTRKNAKTRIPGWNEQKTGGPFVIDAPISGLLDKRSKKSKKRNAFKEHFYATENQLYVAYRYSDSLVSSLTGLKGEAIGLFRNAYPATPTFCRETNDLEFNSWIRYNYKLWIKRDK